MTLKWTAVITIEVDDRITKQEVEAMTDSIISNGVERGLPDLDAKIEIKPPSTDNLPDLKGNLK